MGLIERSRSQRVREGRPTKLTKRSQTDTAVTPVSRSTSVALQRQRSLLEPSTEANNGQGSIQRPRTAGQIRESRSGDQPHREPDTMVFEAGQYTFNFPTPSLRQSPLMEPKSATFPLQHSPLFLESPSKAIGLAIGSPTQMPSWGRSYTADHVSSRMPVKPPPPTRSPPIIPSIPEDLDAPSDKALPKKQRSWKNFGGLFQRKPSKPAPKEQLAQWSEQLENASNQQCDRHHSGLSPNLFGGNFDSPPLLQSPMSPNSRHSHMPSPHRNMARMEARAEADRDIFHPGSAPRPRRTPSMVVASKFPASPLLGDASRTSEDIFKTTDIDRRDSPVEQTGDARFLDIDIPNFEMERYSVMFEKLLEPTQPRLSILERRQSSKLRRLRTDSWGNVIDTSLDTVDERKRAHRSPPPLSRVPGLSITVTRSASQQQHLTQQQPSTMLHRPHGALQRSNTAPPGSISPARAMFNATLQPTAEDEAPSPALTQPSPLYSELSTPFTPTATPGSDDVASTTITYRSQPLDLHHQQNQQEPQWEMLGRQSVKTPNRSLSFSHGPGRRGSERYPRVKSPEDLERHMVQVSVARQVSVSDARRQVRKAVETQQQAAQPLRPRVVQVRKDDGALRKSTVVVVEEA